MGLFSFEGWHVPTGTTFRLVPSYHLMCDLDHTKQANQSLSCLELRFFSAWPRPLTLNSEIRGVRPAPQGTLSFGVKKQYCFKRSSRGSNPEPRASEEDALSTPLRPTWLKCWTTWYKRGFEKLRLNGRVVVNVEDFRVYDLCVKMKKKVWYISLEIVRMGHKKWTTKKQHFSA